MLEAFLLHGLIAGLGVALVAGPLGCFVVWRRMAYFGDALAHSALLGVALGFLLGVNLTVGVLASSVALALFVLLMQTQRRLASDTLLGILAHAMLAFGVIVVSLMDRVRIDLLGYLFGDLLAVTRGDLYWILGGGVLALAALALLWRPLLASSVHEEMARAEGVPVMRVRLGFMILFAVVIAIAMKIVGVLLIISLLIIPAAAVRPFARTPEAMAGLAAGAGVIAVLAGFNGSVEWDLPTGPAIVAAATILFVLCQALAALWRGVARSARA